ncbi:MAG TPA: stage V sporulation protein S [Bacillus sp. (in: firmicutes)]|nr:stage V sporulation protein S [Bacillus sp. (in: firmicutes)]
MIQEPFLQGIKECYFVPAFTDVLINNEHRTAIKLIVGPRNE